MTTRAATSSLIRFDWAIKRLLRNKANYAVLEGFLSVLLKEDVRIVSIGDSESNREHADDKFNRVDILVEDSRGDLVIIEVQNSYEVDYYLRMLYGVSKAITEHIERGDRYEKVRKVYHINIVYFSIGEGEDYVYHGLTEFRGVHRGDLLQLSSEQKKFFEKDSVKDLYPEYYILCVRDFNDVARDSLDEWIYYLKNNAIPETFTARGLAEARRRLQYEVLSEQEKKSYNHHVSQTVYEQNALDSTYLKGHVEGEAKGRAEGKKEIALNLLELGLAAELIAQSTGLTLAEVYALQKE